MSNNRSSFKYERAQIYLVEEHAAQGSEQKKTRPWILVGASPVNRARSTLVAVPLTTSIKEIPGMSIKVYINGIFLCAILDQIRALDKTRFIRYEGDVDQADMDLIDDGLRQILGL